MSLRFLVHSTILLLVMGLAGSVYAMQSRVFEFTYEMELSELPAAEDADIYIPLPANQDGQRVIAQSLESSYPGRVGAEVIHGNRYYHIRKEAGDEAPLLATLRWTVSRDTVQAGSNSAISEADYQRYLEPDKLVPVGHDILNPILDEIRKQRNDDSPEATARAIYDWIVDNIEYKKVGTGWGNGDTFWACSERYGNCTDFHALFVALARTEGIPARFEIGFPVPLSKPEGNIKGYHCWVQYYLPDQGWVPIDASEAAKNPDKRELFYGTQPADRIHFTTGRDLVLSDSSSKQPLNYFIYPHVEIDGKLTRLDVKTRFSYRELD